MERRANWFRQWLSAALLFGLFSEWLRPLAAMAELTEVYRLAPLLGALAVYMFIDVLPLRGWAAWPLKLVFTVAWIGYWFHPEELYSGAWWLQFPELLAADGADLLSGELAIRPESRTLLFLSGWSAVAYAAQRIISERGRALWFVAATVAFLAGLQFWPGIDTSSGLMRSAAYGMLLLAILQGPKWEKLLDGRFAETSSAARSRMLASALCAALLYGAGYALAAGTPDRTEPMPVERWTDWVHAAMKQYGALPADGQSVSSFTGFGWDDSRLGQAVTQNYDVAFVAVTDRPTYWRGESKDVYDGRGWHAASEGGGDDAGEGDAPAVWNASATSGSGSAGGSAGTASGLPENMEQRIEVLSPALARTVFAGGRIVRVPELRDEDGDWVSDIHLRRNEASGAYEIGTRGIRLGSYRIVVELPATSSDALLSDKAPEPKSDRYLQLPDELPERVRELARTIASGVPDHPYSLAAAVQAYLRENYSYTLDTVPPPDGRDFVDHFLFDAKQGYCNHFSTAMVVLLRALGVEARWVKGFAPGEADPDRPNTYLVRNSDAHSWVEVRFAGAGWVPFEATPAAPRAAAAGQGADEAAEGRAGTDRLPVAGALQAAVERAAAAVVEAARQLWSAAPAERWLQAASAAGGLAALALLAAVVPRAIRRLRHRADSAGSRVQRRRRGHDALWRRIYRLRGKPLATETLRDYAARLAADSPPEAREALSEWVRLDEAARYGGGKVLSHRRLVELWRSIAKS